MRARMRARAERPYIPDQPMRRGARMSSNNKVCVFNRSPTCARARRVTALFLFLHWLAHSWIYKIAPAFTAPFSFTVVFPRARHHDPLPARSARHRARRVRSDTSAPPISRHLPFTASLP